LRLTRLLLPITLLAALALTSSAFAEEIEAWGPATNHWAVESYYTQVDNTTTWHYDYIIWYEEWDGSKWARPDIPNPPTLDNIDFYVLEWPTGWGTSGVDDIFVDAGMFDTTGKNSLTATSEKLMDNTDFNGAIDEVSFDGWVDQPNQAKRGWVWSFLPNKTVDGDTIDENWIDNYDNESEEFDPAVRTVYFHNRPTNSFSDTDLNTAWSTYIDPIQNSSDAWATIQKEGAGVADDWFALNSNAPTGWGSYKADSGYNRPYAWLWIELEAPPGPTTGLVMDGGPERGSVWGPTPELNPAFLLMLTLLPASLLLRKRD